MSSLSSALKRKINVWMYKFSKHPNSELTIFTHSIADSSFLPISIDLTFLPISISNPKKVFKFALMAILGSIIGALISYFVGKELFVIFGNIIINMFGGPEQWQQISHSFNNGYAEITLLIAAITPFPFVIGSLSAGFFKMNFWLFLLISILGRTIRFGVLAILIYYLGAAVRDFINKYTKPILIITILSIILLLLTFLI